MLKNIFFRYRYFIASTVIVLGYLFVFDDYLERHFHKYYAAYFSVVVTVILSSGLTLQTRRFSVCIIWALLLPMVASFLGSCVMDIQFFVEKGHFSGVTFWQWFLAASFLGYFLSKLFVVSLVLLAFCFIDYFIFRYSRVAEKL